MEDLPVKHLVVDSGGFIKDAPLRKISGEIYTLNAVVDEIRDKATRDRLQVLPYDIHFREPTPEAVKHVSDFAKKTGDYPSLSAVDLRVMALVYQLEKEHVGTEHIKEHPEPKVKWNTSKKNLEKPTEIAGFYVGPKQKNLKSDTSSQGTESVNIEEVLQASDHDHQHLEQEIDLEMKNSQGNEGESRLLPAVEKLSLNQTHGEGDVVTSSESVAKSDSECTNLNDSRDDDVQKRTDESRLTTASELVENCQSHSSKQVDKVQVSSHCINSEVADTQVDYQDSNALETEGDEAVCELEGTSDFVNEADLEAGDIEEGESDDKQEADDEKDEDAGWITPGNISSMKEKMMKGAGQQRAQVTVGCLTTDFAMQNVLIQMGLNVISVDGMLIKRAKSYVLRCFACMKITKNMMKQFCPNCGNKTLQKVSMTINKDGSVRYFLSKRKQVNTRGTKFSLPMPKGGKHAENPLLCADQPEPMQRLNKFSKVKYDVMDPDYVAKGSPFAPTDLTTRSAQLGIRSFGHHGRNNRNPNEVKKHHGRRK